jgi:hypothetical protein
MYRWPLDQGEIICGLLQLLPGGDAVISVHVAWAKARDREGIFFFFLQYWSLGFALAKQMKGKLNMSPEGILGSSW